MRKDRKEIEMEREGNKKEIDKKRIKKKKGKKREERN